MDTNRTSDLRERDKYTDKDKDKERDRDRDLQNILDIKEPTKTEKVYKSILSCEFAQLVQETTPDYSSLWQMDTATGAKCIHLRIRDLNLTVSVLKHYQLIPFKINRETSEKTYARTRTLEIADAEVDEDKRMKGLFRYFLRLLEYVADKMLYAIVITEIPLLLGADTNEMIKCMKKQKEYDQVQGKYIYMRMCKIPKEIKKT